MYIKCVEITAHTWKPQMLQRFLFKSIEDDLIPPLTMAGFFGMGSVREDNAALNGTLDQHVFGVWQGMRQCGLLTKHKLVDVIEKGEVQSFFEDALNKMASEKHGYALKVIGKTIKFDPLPPLEAKCRTNHVYDLRWALQEVLSIYKHPNFHTQKKREEAWIRVENTLMAVMGLPLYKCEPTYFETLDLVMEMYQVLTDHYGLKRELTQDMKDCEDWLRAMRDPVSDSD